MKKRIIAWAVLLSVCAAALGLWCSAFDCVEVDKDFSRAGDIYCYKDGERTELQLCS